MKTNNSLMKYLMLDQCAIPVAINFVLNALIGWLVFSSVKALPMWGDPSVGGDILATAFLLPFLVTLIASYFIKKQIKNNKTPQINFNADSWWFSLRPVKFGAILGLACMVFCATPMVWILMLGKVDMVSVDSFILFKASWAAILSLFISPIVGMWALVKYSN